MKSDAPPEWHRLFNAALNGQLSDAERADLASVLKSSTEARQLWFLYQDNECSLSELKPRRQIMAPRTALPWLCRRPLAVAATVVLGFFIVWMAPPTPMPVFATLMTTTDAHWSDPNVELALNSGERVTSALRLESGHAEFQMMDGATVALDGPAVVRFAGRKLVRVEEGRVLCKCPTTGSRITVVTPQTQIVDLGTEFSVDARADESTRVAVLSGKVQVMSRDAGVLTTGEVMEVKRDHVVRLQPLTPEEIASLTRKLVPSPAADKAGRNRLADPGFEQSLPSALWRGTDDCIQHSLSGRTGRAVRVRAEQKHFPLVKQRVQTGDISGKVVQSSVWAMSLDDDPILPRQFAVLKLAFLNAEGREFACSTRHFLHKGQPTNVYVPAQLAAQAPPGTHSVEVQLMLGANREKKGSVYFDDASLVIAGDSTK